MAIKLGNSCINCENLSAKSVCTHHKVTVSDSYTCDSFEMKMELKDNRSCVTCLHFEHSTCYNLETAATGMLCSHWAPLNAAS